jgi:hypothetical protein
MGFKKWLERFVPNPDALTAEEGLWPIGNVYIPNSRWNPVYDDRVDDYQSADEAAAVLGRSGDSPPRDEYFWTKAAPDKPINKKYSILFVDDGVHRVLAAVKLGLKWIRATRNLRGNERFHGFKPVD